MFKPFELVQFVVELPEEPRKKIDDKKQISFADKDARIMGKNGNFLVTFKRLYMVIFTRKQTAFLDRLFCFEKGILEWVS